MGAGKVLGAMLGLMAGLLIGGPWAIVLSILAGVAAGHYYDEQHALPPNFPELFSDFPAPVAAPEETALAPPVSAETQAQDDLDLSLCGLFMEVARADGDVRREEVREVRLYFQEVLHSDARTMERIRNQLKAWLARPATLDADAAAEACRDALPSSERLRVLDALYALALVDGSLQRSEREVLRRVAEALDISEEDAHDVATHHLGDGAEHYERLGLPADASDAEVKSAFRRLAAAHHPDKVAHQGPQAAEQAALRFQEIRDAYEEIRRLRGL